jgi:hypothetical protein
MAQEHIVRLVDDLDGGAATQTIVFGWEGAMYEIDLNDNNANALSEFLKPYVGSARRLNARPGRPAGSSPRRTSSGGTSANAPIRDWARANGFTVADGGRLPQAVRDAYFAAHPGEVDSLVDDDGDEGEDSSDEVEVQATSEPSFAERTEQDQGERVA